MTFPKDSSKLVIEKFVKAKITMSFTNPKVSNFYVIEIIQGVQHLRNFTRTYLHQCVQKNASIFQCWINDSKIHSIDYAYLISLTRSPIQHHSDLGNQILTIMNRADYTEGNITHVTHCLTDLILRGCGLKQ